MEECKRLSRLTRREGTVGTKVEWVWVAKLDEELLKPKQLVEGQSKLWIAAPGLGNCESSVAKERGFVVRRHL